MAPWLRNTFGAWIPLWTDTCWVKQRTTRPSTRMQDQAEAPTRTSNTYSFTSVSCSFLMFLVMSFTRVNPSCRTWRSGKTSSLRHFAADFGPSKSPKNQSIRFTLEMGCFHEFSDVQAGQFRTINSVTCHLSIYVAVNFQLTAR